MHSSLFLCCLVSWFSTVRFLVFSSSSLFLTADIRHLRRLVSWSVYGNKRNSVVISLSLFETFHHDLIVLAPRNRTTTSALLLSWSISRQCFTFSSCSMSVSLSLSQFHSARQWSDSCVCVNETTRIYVKPCFSFSLLFSHYVHVGSFFPKSNIAEISPTLFLILECVCFRMLYPFMDVRDERKAIVHQLVRNISPVVPSERNNNKQQPTNIRIERTIKINEHLTWRW